MNKKYLMRSAGFTLVELLLVVAIIGVLAGVLLFAINPFEQFARSRDAGRISVLNQFGKAITQYFVSHGGVAGVAANSFPGSSGVSSWYTDLTTNSNEISTSVTLPSSSTTTCNGVANNPVVLGGGTMCYKILAGNADIAIWTFLESQNETGKINGGCGTGNPAFVYFYSLQKVQVDCLPLRTTVPKLTDTGLGDP